MCNLKENGGLDIGVVRIKNRALLSKWVWRYGEEPSALWRAIIDSKYEGVHTDLIPSLRHKRRFSGLWKNVTKFLENQDNILNGAHLVLDSRSRMVVALASGGMNGSRGMC